MTVRATSSRRAVAPRPVPRIGLNRTELALALGISPNTLDEMVADGSLPPPRVWHSRKIWRIAEVEAAMSEWPQEGAPKEDAGTPPEGWRASA